MGIHLMANLKQKIMLARLTKAVIESWMEEYDYIYSKIPTENGWRSNPEDVWDYEKQEEPKTLYDAKRYPDELLELARALFAMEREAYKDPAIREARLGQEEQVLNRLIRLSMPDGVGAGVSLFEAMKHLSDMKHAKEQGTDTYEFNRPIGMVELSLYGTYIHYYDRAYHPRTFEFAEELFDQYVEKNEWYTSRVSGLSEGDKRQPGGSDMRGRTLTQLYNSVYEFLSASNTLAHTFRRGEEEKLLGFAGRLRYADEWQAITELFGSFVPPHADQTINGPGG